MQVRFVVDAMLGSLARKLRAFGFDTVYQDRGTDEELIETALSSDRVVVTADRELAARSARQGIVSLLVKGDSDAKRIGVVIREASRMGIRLTPGKPRCSVCNGPLTEVTRGEAARRLPRDVAERHRFFQLCTECGKLYWRGSHWKKLRRLRRRFVEADSKG